LNVPESVYIEKQLPDLDKNYQTQFTGGFLENTSDTLGGNENQDTLDNS